MTTLKNTPSFLVRIPDGLASTLLLLNLVAVAVGEESTDAVPSEKLPNVVLILADDLGYGELGCQGNPQIPTPHIDEIASSGVRFAQGYVTAPNCSPSRAALLVGKFGTRFGHEFNPIGAKNEDPAYGLPQTQTTIADRLVTCGYVTGIIGKWHLGGSAPYHPFRRGFDEFFGFTHEGHFFVPHPWLETTTMLRRETLPGGGQGRRQFGDVIYGTHLPYNEPDYDANNPIVRASQPTAESEYLTDAWTREGVDFIRRHQDKPFFLFMAHNAVHSPLQARNDDLKRFSYIEDIQRRIFAAMLHRLDVSVGRVVHTLRQLQLERKTLVIFLSDNGGPTRELTSSNLPLRGGKGQMYEGGIRVPFMMSWPGVLPQGHVYEHPVSSVDLHATILALAGANPVPASDGIDLMPYLRLSKAKTTRPHETLYWRQGVRAALRHRDWKLVRHSGRGKQPGEWQLFDLSQDISEQIDLADDRPAVADDMIRRWKLLDQQMSQPAFR